MTPLQFVEKWRPVALTERAAAQEHFIDLCHLFDHPTPVGNDPTGDSFTFEKGVKKAGGGDGFADVWYKEHFAWEYKKRKRSLADALEQLSRYALALESPPLHIACDTESFRVVTAYTNAVPRSYDISLNDILDVSKRSVLEAAFYDPQKLKPGAARADLTREAADKFCTLAERMQARGADAVEVTHFINQLVFLFFAEDVGLIESNYFRQTVNNLCLRPHNSKKVLTNLFQTFRTGGDFGKDYLPWINGGLFDERAALDLDSHELALLKAAGSQNWAHIDPTIFGTLFERFLDPGKRAQIGAHYTDAVKILQIIKPVIIAPLEEEWQTARSKIDFLTTKARSKGAKAKEWISAEKERTNFLSMLSGLSILDPACGSGNFLYMALQAVKDIELKANQECEVMGLPPKIPMVGPEILHGIEINALASEVAKTAIWIGDIQWGIQNGIRGRAEPILRDLKTIETRDALVDEEGLPSKWPKADFIVGNPPFLGSRKIAPELGKEYAESIRKAYRGLVPSGGDLVTFWFAKAWEALKNDAATRVGLVATKAITGRSNRNVLAPIAEAKAFIEVLREEEWTVEGAAVSVSLITFGGKVCENPILDGGYVKAIHSDLRGSKTTTSFDITEARKLAQNALVCFQGVVPRASLETKQAAKLKLGSATFNLDGATARKLIQEPSNVNGEKNDCVIRSYAIGRDITKRPLDRFIIDFCGRTLAEAKCFEDPFNMIANVQKHRAAMGQPEALETWWQFWRDRTDLRQRLSKLRRYIATSRVSKHRVFVWEDSRVLPDNAVAVIAREDDFALGILQSKFHMEWAHRLGSALESRPRYTSTTTFDTFPFPDKMTPDLDIREVSQEKSAQDVAEKAIALDNLRKAWLYPPEFGVFVNDVSSKLPPRFAVNPTKSKEIGKRTMSALYNKKPDWLKDAHADLDNAVARAYGWPIDIGVEAALASLLVLNLARAASSPSIGETPAR